MAKKHAQHSGWLKRTLLVLGLIIGLALVFNEPIKLFVVDHIGQQTMQKIDKNAVKKNQKQKGNFDFKAVKPLGVSQVAKAATSATYKNAIGKIAVPAVNMKLPVLLGLSNENLSTGAGTMKADQQMGSGNYALAGHYMTNKGILFSPLKNAAVGQKIYLTDMSKVYTYDITTKTTVDETQVQWINDVAGKSLVTLITCASATEGETNRIVVQGTLSDTQPANKTTLAVFN